MGVLVLLSLASGALSAWAVSQHSSAASSVAAVHEPLSLDAQQMYEAVADADVTITGSLLASQQPPQRQLQRYRADIAEAAASLADLKDTGGNPQLTAAIATFSTGLPLYTGYVAQAQDLYSVGYPLTGGSFLQVASEEAHLTLLPAAKAIYAQENAATSAASDQATGLPTVIIALVLALAAGFALYRAQRWLARPDPPDIQLRPGRSVDRPDRQRGMARGDVRGGPFGPGHRARAGRTPGGGPGAGQYRRPADPGRRDPQRDLAQRQHVLRDGLQHREGRDRPAALGSGG